MKNRFFVFKPVVNIKLTRFQAVCELEAERPNKVLVLLLVVDVDIGLLLKKEEIY